ncbi:extracellular solute-binding protein [Streptomyces sp. NPDC053513]|uniref:extracellular solute-binding protein n=1 Tax=unclassified Streptomyces TaxID=2593676 RepID=UPI0037D0E088
MPRRHALIAAAAALVLSVSFTGCARVEAGEVTLRLVVADYEVGGHSDGTEQYWGGLAEAFESAHPGISVQVEVESWEDVDRKVAHMVKAGETPDLAQGGAYADYAARGELYATDQLLSVPVQANFLRSLAEAGEYERVQYGMPFTASTELLFYNKELFAEAGIKAPPATWDEVKKAAQQLKSRTKVRHPIALPFGPEEAQIEAMVWMLGGGGGYTALNGSYMIDSHENIDSLNWVKKNLVEEGLTGPVPPGRLDRKDAYAAFLHGEVGMVNGYPSLIQAAEAEGMHVGMTALPSRERKATSAPGVVDWIMAFKRNGHRKEVGEFLDFLFSDENVREFAALNNLLPVTSTVTYRMGADEKHRSLRPFLEEMPNAVLPPLGKTSWASVSESTRRNIGTAMTPGGSPDASLRLIADDAYRAEHAD